MTPLETLRALGTGDEPPLESKQRVYGALLASLEAAAGAAAAASALAKAPATVPPVIASITSGKALAIAAGIWLIGGATGAALFGAFHPQQVRVVYVDRPVLSSPAPVVESAPLIASAVEPLPANRAPSLGSGTRGLAVAPSASSAPNASSELARERALLDLARAHAAHGEPALVLEQVELHSRQFPHGRLSEEREALAIRALLGLGRADEARARATAFRAAYPNSFLTPVLDSALSAP